MTYERIRWILCCATVLFCGSACKQTPTTSQPDYKIVGDAIPEALTETPGSVEAGREVFVARETGHCVACHKVASLDAPFQGDVGPDLTAVGRRLNAAQIRLRVVDASALNPSTIMPSYYLRDGLHRVAPEYVGKTVLNPQQIEHLVAFLVTLNR